MRRLSATIAVVVLCCSLATAKTKKIHGYVTNIISPTSFEIEDYRITRDAGLILELEKGDSDASIEFRPEDIRVGTELQITGDFDETTGELRAKSMKVFLEEHKKIKRTALMSERPRLEKVPGGWQGVFFADGQSIRVTPATQLVFKPNRSEAVALKQREKARKTQPKAKDDEVAGDEEQLSRPLESLDEVGPNVFMTYEGRREEDGSVSATRVEFVRNELEKGEARLWKQITPKVKEPAYIQSKAGDLKIPRVGNFKILANQQAQEYIRKLGEQMVPAYQRALPAGDPNKIAFRFFLVENKHTNAFALANGAVVIYSQMLTVLENEAQLAAVVGHEIAHSVQEHTVRQLTYHRKKRIALNIGAAVAAGFGAYAVRDVLNMVEAAIRNGYSRALENQADRIGLEYLIHAGYDPREAPRVWKVMAKKYGDQPTNFFWSTHENHTTRRSYLMAELRNNYADLRYDGLKANSEEFDRIAQEIRSGKGSKQKIKVRH